MRVSLPDLTAILHVDSVSVSWNKRRHNQSLGSFSCDSTSSSDSMPVPDTFLNFTKLFFCFFSPNTEKLQLHTACIHIDILRVGLQRFLLPMLWWLGHFLYLNILSWNIDRNWIAPLKSELKHIFHMSPWIKLIFHFWTEILTLISKQSTFLIPSVDVLWHWRILHSQVWMTIFFFPVCGLNHS